MPNNNAHKPDSTFAAVHIQISGRVQGVGFRYFAEESALGLGIVGWVRNRSDGGVEIEAEGSEEVLQRWLEQLKKGPTMARIERLNVDWTTYNHRFTNFVIH